MTDLFELIERVQVTLASSHVPEKDQLRSLHQELDHEIRSANRRLRECDALLAGGHRSEAIQLAEQEPPLLDVVSILDFAELPEWNDYVAELGLTVTPELLVDVATDLNLAYAEDAPLERHLRQLRLFSLARVPLRMRIDLLRKIANLDPLNPVWEDDLSKYEEARLRQIKEEFRDANRSGDVETLNELAAELQGRWLIEPRGQFINSVTQAVKRLESSHAARRLGKVAGELQEARKAGDLARATELSEQWNSLSRLCPADSAELSDARAKAQLALNWVKHQRSVQSDRRDFLKKVELLQRAIDSGMDLNNLRKRYVAATRFSNFALPDEVGQDYDEAVRRLEERKRTRLIILVSCIVAAIVVAGIAIGVVIGMASARSGQADRGQSPPAALADFEFRNTGGKPKNVVVDLRVIPNGVPFRQDRPDER